MRATSAGFHTLLAGSVALMPWLPGWPRSIIKQELRVRKLIHLTSFSPFFTFSLIVFLVVQVVAYWIFHPGVIPGHMTSFVWHEKDLAGLDGCGCVIKVGPRCMRARVCVRERGRQTKREMEMERRLRVPMFWFIRIV